MQSPQYSEQLQHSYNMQIEPPDVCNEPVGIYEEEQTHTYTTSTHKDIHTSAQNFAVFDNKKKKLSEFKKNKKQKHENGMRVFFRQKREGRKNGGGDLRKLKNGDKIRIK